MCECDCLSGLLVRAVASESGVLGSNQIKGRKGCEGEGEEEEVEVEEEEEVEKIFFCLIQ